jgi:hypothetical protein
LSSGPPIGYLHFCITEKNEPDVSNIHAANTVADIHLTTDSQVTLHSKEAIKSQLINANLNHNNIKLQGVSSMGKVVEYPHNEECSSETLQDIRLE